jgi:aspartate/methionine/tyrosine aminotransferase
LPELREALSRYYATSYAIEVPAERIIITSGSSGALFLTLAVLVDPGSQVIVADPGYPANRHFVRVLDGEPLNVPVDAESGYQLTPDAIERSWTERTVAAIVATPSNPSGAVVDLGDLERMAVYCSGRGGKLIVDEIYHGLVYEGQAQSALAVSDEVFVINSFSKFFNMTGWRLGWMVAPPAYVRALEKVAQNIYLSPPAPAQFAALAAFEPETLSILAQRREAFRARRDYLVPALRRLGFDVSQTPAGAFYVYAGCSKLTDDSVSFAMDLLEHAGVAITPGVDFGEHEAASHVRFAYTNGPERLQEAMLRIDRFLSVRAKRR